MGRQEERGLDKREELPPAALLPEPLAAWPQWMMEPLQ